MLGGYLIPHSSNGGGLGWYQMEQSGQAAVAQSED